MAHMTRPVRPRFPLAVVLGLATLTPGLPAWADQPTPDQPTPPATLPPATPRPVVVPAFEQPTLEPVRPGLPPPPAADLGQRVTPGLVREGALISQARARVVQGRSGRWYAIFDNASGGRALPPMILLESASLAQVVRAAERAGPDGRMLLSGAVTVYRNHNYLLPSGAPLLERIETAPAVQQTPPSTPPTAPEPAPTQAAPAGGATPADPSIDQIVAELDKAAGPRPEAPSVRLAQEPAEAPVENAAAPRIMPAGFLAARKARIVRGADGRLMARFDAGPSGATQAPMALLPNQNTQAIESLIDTIGDLGTITLSGNVQVYRGRNFLLPTMYVVERATDNLTPLQ
jgi:hypothetical protein